MAGALYVIEITGSPKELGNSLGRYFGDSIRDSVAVALEDAPRGWRDHTGTAAKLLKRDFPELFAEVAATAQTAGVPLEGYLLWMSEELWDGAGQKGCTDLMATGKATANGETLIGHNNDTRVAIEAPVVVRYRPTGKPGFLAFSFDTTISLAANEAGMVLAGNEVPCGDVKPGIPRRLLTRLSCEVESLKQARKLFEYADRASSYNNVVGDRDGRVMNLEGSATKSREISLRDGMLVHTNHHLALKGVAAGEPDPKSLSRQARAELLMAQGAGRHSVESFQRILSDHERYSPADGNICRHGPEKETKFSVVFEPQRGLAWYAPGNPCMRPALALDYW